MKLHPKVLLLVMFFLIGQLPLNSIANSGYRKGSENISVISSSESELSTISVTGFGKSSSQEPDIANFSITIRTEDKTAAGATSKNAELSQKILGILASNGVPKSDITTSGFSVNLEFDFKDGKSEIIGYVATNVLSIEVPADNVGGIIDAVTVEDVSIGGISFKLKEENQNKKITEALANAVKDAKTKADAIAMAAGVSIIGIKSISESASFSPFDRSTFLGAAGASTEILPEDITVTAQVSVSYILD